MAHYCIHRRIQAQLRTRAHPHPAAGYRKAVSETRLPYSSILSGFQSRGRALGGPIGDRFAGVIKRQSIEQLALELLFPSGRASKLTASLLWSRDTHTTATTTTSPPNPPLPLRSLPISRRNGGCGAAGCLDGNEASRHFLRLRREPPARAPEDLRLGVAQCALDCARAAPDHCSAMP